MKRREALQVATATALAHTVVTVLGCRAAPPAAPAQSGEGAPTSNNASPVTPALAAAADAAARCVTVGETCLEHCVRDLSTGSVMMAECAKALQPMLALCRALASLAAMGSPYAQKLVPLCLSACVECRAVCEKHAGHHVECKNCRDACVACEEACRALV